MTRWSSQSRSDELLDGAIPRPEEVALARLLTAAREAPRTVDPAALESALAVYRSADVAAGDPSIHVEPARPSRRRRWVEALAATTLVTKIVVGVAAAAVAGGVGVGVTEVVHHRPAPVAPRSVVPTPSAPPATGSRSPSPSPSASATSTATPSPSSATTTDEAPGNTRSPTSTGSPSSTMSRTATTSPSRSASTSETPGRSATTSPPS